jgi:hypothetical protein
MANKLVQRLIAAGASPARANAFATQFLASQPNVNTADLEDAFDDQLAELSKAYFTNAFRPPAIDDPRIDDYVSFVYGPTKFKDLETKVFLTKAPEFSKSKLATNYAKTITGYIEAGATPAEIDTLIAADAAANELTKANFTVIDPMKTVKQAASDYASKLFNEYSTAKGSIDKAKADFLAKDKTYAAGLPSPKLKYGLTENLAKGEVSWKTNPKAEMVLKNEASKVQSTLKNQYGDKGPQSSAAAGIASSDDPALNQRLYKDFMTQKKIPTPLKDEIARREYLKDKTGK